MIILVLCLSGCVASPSGSNRADRDVSVDTMSADRLVRLAIGLEQSGNLKGAQRMIDRALSQAPGHLEANRLQGKIMIRTGNGEAGRQLLGILFQNNPGDKALRLTYGEALVAARLYGEAFEVVGPLANQSGPSDATVFVARVSDVNGDLLMSRRLFEEALEKAPTRTNIRVDLALSFAADGAFETAAAILDPDLNAAGREAEARRGLAFVQALSGDTAGAIETAMTASSATDLAPLRSAFEILPTLTRQEKIAALYFDHWPERVVWRPGS